MNTNTDCFPCFLNHVLQVGKQLTEDERFLKNALDEAGSLFREIFMEQTPPEALGKIFRKLREISGNRDPFSDFKKKSIAMALPLLSGYIKKVNESDDVLSSSLCLTATGTSMSSDDFAVFEMEKFRKCLKKAGNILFIGDEAVESVTDRILIKALGKPVTYVVRGIPVYSQVTYEDAVQAKVFMDADIFSAQTGAPGAAVRTCNSEFERLLENAGMIISRGKGNYAALSGEKFPIFFLLKADCPVIAGDIEIEQGQYVLKSINC